LNAVKRPKAQIDLSDAFRVSDFLGSGATRSTVVLANGKPGLPDAGYFTGQDVSAGPDTKAWIVYKALAGDAVASQVLYPKAVDLH
jgi:hypothetical protein